MCRTRIYPPPKGRGSSSSSMSGVVPFRWGNGLCTFPSLAAIAAMTAFEDCAYKPGPGQAFKTSAKVNSLDFIWSTTAEYEVPEFNLGNTFNHSDMAELMTPRPFMVERGHEDGVSYDS